ncbi:MAG: (d)CMP kinase [Ruminococcus sp.]|nr:(d)CMP kinase [Candidatus Apopatosoma intestinale]
MINIAIDGPSGSGKSTVANVLAEKLGYIHVDTGALYRAVGLFVKRSGIAPDDESAVVSLLSDIDLRLVFEDGEQKVMLNGENVNGLIRTAEISAFASRVSAIPAVRSFLLDLQREIARTNNIIMDGRDIGTVILPDATVKFFMTASDEARAERRFAELAAKGEKTTPEEVRAAMEKRDRQDSTRAVAPAVPAEDAIFIDNSGPFDQTLEKILSIIKEKTK